MSWVVSKANEKLKEAIQEAKENNILMFCATADHGSQSRPDIYPASYEEVIVVSASNALGMPRLESQHDVHMMLDGDKVKAHGPSFMKQCQDAEVSGSSVATALAAGIASLCLLLARMANRGEDAEKFKDRLMMLRLFRLMQASKSNRVIVPSQLFDDKFDIPDDFSKGRSEPPIGLEKFRFAVVHAFLETNRANRFNGDIPRRDLSEERIRQR
jgi:hypothetical protein